MELTVPSLILHSFRRCPFAIRVRMTLAEKRLAYSLIEEDLSNPSTELLRHSPEGKVPVLIHGELVLRESAVITEYLEESFPEHPLLPVSPALRARARLWTVWCHDAFKPELDRFKYDQAKMIESARDENLRQLTILLRELENALRDSPFLLGEVLSLADIHVFPFYRQFTRVRPELPGHLQNFPKLHAWLERITSRPSFQQVMAKPEKQLESDSTG